MTAEQKVQFYNLLEQTISKLNEKNRETFCITQEKYDRVLTTVELPKGEKCVYGANFKFWYNKNFKVQKIGARYVLYCLKTSCPVITKEELFDTIKRCVFYKKRIKHCVNKLNVNKVTSDLSLTITG